MCGLTVSVALHRSGQSCSKDQPSDESTKPTPQRQNANSLGDLRTKLNKSLDLIAHRGPDAKGVWISDDGMVGLAHNRLSINDLSPEGNQPIHSDDGLIHAVVNGEIYDYDRIRQSLSDSGYRFSSRSDSELVVALYQRYGAPSFLDHLRGEFAFVLCDESTGKIIAARDRFGVKPLFWTVVEGKGQARVLIAAEAKAFLALDWKPEWDVGAIADGGWEHGDRTLFRGVKKVLPGHYMELTADGRTVHQRYWDIEYRNKREVETRTVDEMVLGVREQLIEAIRLRLRADVPIGIYLSGGIDSSIVAGIVAHLVREQGVKLGNQDAASRIRCFSIQFPEGSGYDESGIDIAERTADWLGVQIFKKHMDEDALAEYFADSAYYCEHHSVDLNSVGKFGLSSLPREHGFKVVLTGEGSDEHFGGYTFFPPDFLLEPDYSMPDLPLSRDKTLREALQSSTQNALKHKLSRLGFFTHEVEGPERFQSVNGISMFDCNRVRQVPLRMFAGWVRQRWRGIDSRETASNAISPEAMEKIREKWHPLHSSQYIFSRSMLANILLSCLGDRTEMAHSIEARPPFLDHVLSDYANGLPPSLKVVYDPTKPGSSAGKGPWWEETNAASHAFSEKWILREAGKPFMSQELYERRKHPYTAPVKWPKGGPMYNKLRDICTRDAVENLGFLEHDVVERAFEDGFGDDAVASSARFLFCVGAWVTLSERFGVRRARVEDHA
ncbi:asparagine synthase [Immersiella caudata]|uniref:Asparagine synthase n=1 Tax=Immersiella caudata TaxID=314043 RepID=A0AA40CBN4_9PEZI|nr:asparagine synthase [Immersiella caudata]